jgi:hypothetical protein
LIEFCRYEFGRSRGVPDALETDAEMITGADLRVDAGAIAKYWPWLPHA